MRKFTTSRTVACWLELQRPGHVVTLASVAPVAPLSATGFAAIPNLLPYDGLEDDTFYLVEYSFYRCKNGKESSADTPLTLVVLLEHTVNKRVWRGTL